MHRRKRASMILIRGFHLLASQIADRVRPVFGFHLPH